MFFSASSGARVKTVCRGTDRVLASCPHFQCTHRFENAPLSPCSARLLATLARRMMATSTLVAWPSACLASRPTGPVSAPQCAPARRYAFNAQRALQASILVARLQLRQGRACPRARRCCAGPCWRAVRPGCVHWPRSWPAWPSAASRPPVGRWAVGLCLGTIACPLDNVVSGSSDSEGSSPLHFERMASRTQESLLARIDLLLSVHTTVVECTLCAIGGARPVVSTPSLPPPPGQTAGEKERGRRRARWGGVCSRSCRTLRRGRPS